MIHEELVDQIICPQFHKVFYVIKEIYALDWDIP